MSESGKKNEDEGPAGRPQSDAPPTRPRRAGRSGRGVDSLLPQLRQQHAERDPDETGRN